MYRLYKRCITIQFNALKARQFRGSYIEITFNSPRQLSDFMIKFFLTYIHYGKIEELVIEGNTLRFKDYGYILEEIICEN